MFLLISFLLFVSQTSAQSTPPASAPQPWQRRDCPVAPLPENLVTPTGLRNFIMSNQTTITTPDQLICCLPESYRNSYVTSHSSIAAQSGNVRSPRVILYRTEATQNGELPRLQSAISINGGGADLNNPMNVEVLFNNHRTRQVELYDIDFSRRRAHMSGLNPEACLNCHGGGPSNVGGPRTIFDPFGAWVRFQQGIFRACNPDEGSLLQQMQRTGREAFRENPRFRCLNPAENNVQTDHLSDTSPNVTLLDSLLARENGRRVAQIVRRTANYDQYKFAIIGSIECAQGGVNFTPPLPLNDWLPAAALARHTDNSTLLPEVARSTNLIGTLRQGLQKDREEAEELRAYQRAAVQRLRNGETPEFRIATGRGACLTPALTEDLLRETQRRMTGPELYNRYIVDTEMRGMRTSTANPTLRYLFESRGIPTDSWGMTPSAGDYHRTTLSVRDLVDAESPGSELRRQYESFGMNSNKPRREPFCAWLRQRSLTALTPATTSATPTPTVRATPATR